MWCWRRMEKISWTDHVSNEEVLLKANEQRNILHEIRKRKANLIGHILRRNCLLQQVIEGKIKGQIEVTRRRGRRRKKLLDDLKDTRGHCQLKEETLDRTMWRNLLEEALELSFDRLLKMMITLIVFGKLYLGVYGRIILKYIFKCLMGHVDWFDLALNRGWWRAIESGNESPGS